MNKLAEKMVKAILLVAEDYEPEQVLDAVQAAAIWLIKEYGKMQPASLEIKEHE